MPPAMANPLGVPGFSFDDLHDARRLADLTRTFDERLRAADAVLYDRYAAHRSGVATLAGPQESDLLIELSGHLSRFVGALFGVAKDQAALRETAGRDAPIFKVKREFIQRRVFKKGAPNRPAPSEAAALEAQAQPLFAAAARVSSAGDDHELIVALVIETLLDAERALSMHFDPAKPAPLDAAAFDKFCALVKVFGESRSGAAAPDDLLLARRLLDLIDRWAYVARRPWPLFKLPHTLDFENLVPLKRDGFAITGHEEHQRRRDGFGLTDPRATAREVQSEIHYCLFCHDREKDSCATGFPEKGSSHYKKNPLGIPLTGCPLEERISEMHLVAREGDMVAALALVCIDNPMAPGTGHRICNDCMKACVYQKQEPVNIPQIETRVLSDTLRMRWGFEIWSLLTRWNPLNMKRQHPREYTGVNVLVVGMGPAGYTLAHHLLNEGFGVVGIDGLKIEPIDRSLTPVEHYDARFGKPLDERITSGFGGVSEYGITVRWDKSFLDVLHLNLARRTHFRLYGGTRFGGTIQVDEAFDRYGFDHVALATGAGKPTVIPLKNNLIRGVRKASDFLMALQLSGAYKANALANLQVRLPAVVIGGGLTAIDTATELAAYYPIQVEKLLARHEVLCAASGEELVFSLLDPEERHVYAEFLEHGRAVRQQRESGALDFARLVKSWGGVTIAYRKGLNDSPAYRLNHEEVLKCLEEGIVFAEGLSPLEAVPDAQGAVQAVKFSRKDGTQITLEARTVCVAAGTSPNVTVEKEAPGLFEIDPEHHAFRSFLADRTQGEVTDDLSGKAGFFTSYAKHGRHISFFGDNNPEYAGSVVKAMASAKDGYPHIVKLFESRLQPAPVQRWTELTAMLDDELNATVHEVRRLTPTIVEVIVRARAAARSFQPGQFYRLQNFESLCAEVDGTRLLMEGLALTGAWVDREQGLLSMIVLEMGTSSRLCAALKPGEPVVVMGPTGAPSTIPRGEDVALCGGGLGNAVLFSISRALRANGCRVVYFAGYRHAQDVFKRDEIEESTDVVVWSVDKGSTPPLPRRPQDRAFSGNMVEAMLAYATGEFGEPPVPLSNVRRIIAIGSDRMMAAVARARHAELKAFLPADHVGIASINSPMQCMMKEICAQCLQKHRDPVTGKESVVFTCFDQDQPMDRLDWDNLRARLRSNSLQEKLSALWLQRLDNLRPKGPPQPL
jgi:NADPH-dependent glutamate synthase beta subunit-like oxidoreductase/NAD(P)H-flavin reductase